MNLKKICHTLKNMSLSTRAYFYNKKIQNGEHFPHGEIPYICKYADKSRVKEFANDRSKIITDAQRTQTGATSIQQYALRSPNTCAIAALNSILIHQKKEKNNQTIPLAIDALTNGVYKKKGNQIYGAYHKSLCKRITKKRGRITKRHQYLAIETLPYLLEKNYILLSVHPDIKFASEKHNSHKQKTGHIVLMTGYIVTNKQLSHIIIHNSSGYQHNNSQENHMISISSFLSYRSKRVILIRNIK